MTNNQLSINNLITEFKYFFYTIISLLLFAFYYSQAAYADTGITITKAKKPEITTYSGPSSSKKLHETINESKLKNIPVKKNAMNGRFLNVEVDGKGQWIKAKQVFTTQTYDVGACESQNKSSGTRAAVNCTDK